jgi:hypothetical protein
MMRNEVTRQLMNHTMSTAVKKCLHLCTEITALCRDSLRRLNPGKLTTGILWLPVSNKCHGRLLYTVETIQETVDFVFLSAYQIC